MLRVGEGQLFSSQGCDPKEGPTLLRRLLFLGYQPQDDGGGGKGMAGTTRENGMSVLAHVQCCS